jgi:hypothetical protein
MKKEELTDMFTPKAIAAFRVGQVLKFEDGTQIKITRKTKTRIWGQHITLVDLDRGMSHYGHNLDVTKDPPYCEDCEATIRELATTTGNLKSMQREDERVKTEDGK